MRKLAHPICGLLFLIATVRAETPASAHAADTEGHKIAAYLRKLQSASGGQHLFGHESTINMGVAGDRDWVEPKLAAFTGVDVHSLRSDVKEMTGELPAILGYDAFKLILTSPTAHRVAAKWTPASRP